jgi:uncharacterized membrane protein YdbT with pleckstrin-like domain
MPKSTSIDFMPEFIGQRASEEIEIILFKHWYFIIAPIIKALVIILLSFIVPMWLHLTAWIFSYGFTTALYYLWMVFWIGYMVYAYINWYRDRFIITTERVIDVDQRGLFSRKVSEVELSKIQNITHSVDGVFATLLNFGTVIVQSAGANDLTLEHVSDPSGVQEEITRLVKTVTADKSVTAEDLIDFIKGKKE